MRKGRTRASGGRREAAPEGSVEQSRGPMDKQRIRGRSGRTSEQPIAKSTAIKDRSGRSDGRAAKAVGLTSGGLRCCIGNETEDVVRRPERSAEVSRGHSRRSDPPKARTDGSGDRSRHLDDAMRQKTGGVRPARQDWRVKPDGAATPGTEASSQMHASKLRRPPLLWEQVSAQIHRTAVYGPVCTVVWEGRSREAPPYPDYRRHASGHD